MDARSASVPQRVASPGTAFYTVTDSNHFLGAVGLLNSLRLVGHTEPLIILDCGLKRRQREQLATAARLVPAPTHGAPTSVKNVAPLAYPTEVMVLLDADVIVTRRLDAQIQAAREGRLVVFTDDTPDRFFDEWSELGLGRPRPQTYVSAGHLVAPFALAETVLRRVDELAKRVDVSRTFVRGGSPRDSLYYLDQDILNAVLATIVRREQIEVLGTGFAAYTPFPNLELVDDISLECRYPNGFSPLLLHHVLKKPWLHAVRPSVYSRLLTRLLSGPGLAVTPDTDEVPVRLRSGGLAPLDRRRAHIQAVLHDRVRGRLGVRPRLERLLREYASGPN